MKWSRVRMGLSVLLVLVACGVAVVEFKDHLGVEPSLDDRIRQLERGWTRERREAATVLGQFSGEADKVVPALVKALDDSDAEVRHGAMRSLSALGERAKLAAPKLRNLVDHGQDQETRRQAAGLLGLLKDRESVPALTACLDEPAEAVSVEAARALGRFGAEISTQPLVDKLMAILIGDHSVELRDASLDALDSIAAELERVGRAKADILARDPSPMLRLKAVGGLKKPTFDFVIPALVAAMDDSDPQVRLSAASNLAWIGLSDDRPVPALCQAAINADDRTREGISMVMDTLSLDATRTHTPDDRDQSRRRFQTAVKELRTVLETRTAAAREQVVNVLGRIIASYQNSAQPALLEPAREAVAAVLARMEDETEDDALRLSAMNQWTVIQPLHASRAPRGGTAGAGAGPVEDELHSRAAWIDGLVRTLKSRSGGVRSRAAEVLVDSLRDPGTDPSFRDAWRKAVAGLVESAASQDAKVRDCSLAILGMLGPVAGQALGPMSSLARDAKDPAVRSAALGVVRLGLRDRGAASQGRT